jgi:hypothetical protein
MGFFDNLGSAIGGGLDLLSATFSHPIKAAGGYIDLAINRPKGAEELNNLVLQTKSEGPTKTITNTVINTATASAILLSAGAATGSTGIVGTAGKAITTAIKNKPILLAAPVVASFGANLITSSPKIQQQIKKIDPATFGSDIGNLIENPSLDAAKQVAVNNPVLTAVTGGAAALAVGGGVATLTGNILNYENTKAVQKNTAATLQSGNGSITSDIPERVVSIMPTTAESNLPTGSAATSVVSAPVGSSGSVVKKKITTKKKKKKSTTKNKKKSTAKKKKKVYKKKKSTKHKKHKKKK